MALITRVVAGCLVLLVVRAGADHSGIGTKAGPALLDKVLVEGKPPLLPIQTVNIGFLAAAEALAGLQLMLVVIILPRQILVTEVLDIDLILLGQLSTMAAVVVVVQMIGKTPAQLAVLAAAAMADTTPAPIL